MQIPKQQWGLTTGGAFFIVLEPKDMKVSRKEQQLAEKLLTVINSKFVDVRLTGQSVQVSDRRGKTVVVQSPQRINSTNTVVLR